MKNINLLLIILMLYGNIIAQVQIAPDASIFEGNTYGNPNPAVIFPKVLTPPNSPDIRIHPTTNSIQSEMSISISPINDQILLASANTRVYPDLSLLGTGYYYSTDGGENWSGSDQPPIGGINHGDPAVVIDRNGYFYLNCISSDFGQCIYRSTNNGSTWEYYIIESPHSPDPPFVYPLDKNHLAVDNSFGQNGGNLYAAWSNFYYSNRRIEFARSTTHGINWTTTAVISSGLADPNIFAHQGVNLQVGSDGTVYACWAVRDINSPFIERGIGFNKSTDGGQNWLATPRYAINNILGMRSNLHPTLGFRTNSFPVMAVDKRTDKIYIAWVNIGVPGINNGDPDVYIISSNDKGATWSNPRRVNTDQINNGAIQFHCWLTVDQVTGDVYVAFYDNRASSDPTICEFYVAKSVDGGESFSDFAVSDAAFGVSAIHSNYNGEYPGIVANAGKVYPLWHSKNPSENAQGWLSKIVFPLITVDQKNKNGNRLYSTDIGRWNKVRFVSNQISNNSIKMSVEDGATEVLRGYQQPYAGEKYNRWTKNNIYNDPDVTNHHIFSITNEITDLTSQFLPISASTTIKNKFLESPTLNPTEDSIQFKDPWFMDYQDALYGNNLRNRGMDLALLRTRLSPFFPNYNTVFNNGSDPSQSYKGVFLNQGWPGWNPPYYSVAAISPQPITINGRTHNFYFQNWGGENVEYQYPNQLETGVVFTNENAVATANMKGTQLSNNETAYANNSQRKLVRTQNGYLHCVYESMERVWYERSTNNGATWEIMNDGKPLDDNPCKSPAIDFRGNIVSIAYQLKDDDIEDWSLLTIKEFDGSALIFSDFGYADVPYAYNAQIAHITDENYKAIIFKENDQGILKILDYANRAHENDWTWQISNILNTDNSNFPSAAKFINDNRYVHLIFQKTKDISTNSYSISYGRLRFREIGWSMDSFNPDISNRSGFNKNIKPSIIAVNFDGSEQARICWISERRDGRGTYSPEKVEKTVVFYATDNPNRYWTFGDNVNSVSINKCNDRYVVAWARSNDDQIQFTDSRTLSAPYYQLNIKGKDVQLSNGTTPTTMYAMAFNTKEQPFYMQAERVYTNPKPIYADEKREGIVSEEQAQVYFNLGDVVVDDEQISFVDIPDTVGINSLQTANEYLVSEPFTLTDNSNFFYSVKYGITDSMLAANMLQGSKTLTFEVELLDAQTNELLGVFDEVTYSQNNLTPYEKIDYQVLTNGIGERLVKMRLVISNNFAPEYSVAEKYEEPSGLAKKSYKQINYQGSLAVKEYALEQNYPNPFNPTTTINYQIKEDGLVTLKLYDILGSEVITLVNEDTTKGSYSYNFNASDLASGVYIYQLRVNDFVSAKKLMLLK